MGQVLAFDRGDRRRMLAQQEEPVEGWSAGALLFCGFALGLACCLLIVCA